MTTLTTLVKLSDKTATGLPWCRKTVIAKSKSDPDFPPVIMVEGRRYVERSSIETYKAKLLRRAK
jgi:hypothetical protein